MPLPWSPHSAIGFQQHKHQHHGDYDVDFSFLQDDPPVLRQLGPARIQARPRRVDNVRPEPLGGRLVRHHEDGVQARHQLLRHGRAYDDGNAEVFLGGAIQKGIADGLWTREDLVITTKIFGGTKGFFEGGPNGQGLSRKHLVEGTKVSLKKLQTDYVDVIFCHRSEKYTPIEETVRAMNYIIDQGWAFYWGTSEWSPAAIKEACAIADRLGMIRPIVEQTEYSLLERSKVEFQYAELIETTKLGLTVWAPLSSGILTGKYNDGIPENARMSKPEFRTWMPDFEHRVDVARQLAPIAARLNCSLAQLAIAWCVSNESVSTVLLGARDAKQLEETVSALEVEARLTPEVKAEIDAIAAFQPRLWAPDVMYTLRERFLRHGAQKPAWANATTSKSE